MGFGEEAPKKIPIFGKRHNPEGAPHLPQATPVAPDETLQADVGRIAEAQTSASLDELERQLAESYKERPDILEELNLHIAGKRRGLEAAKERNRPRPVE